MRNKMRVNCLRYSTMGLPDQSDSFPFPKENYVKIKNIVTNLKILLLFKMRTSKCINTHRGDNISLTALNLSFVPSLCLGSTEHSIFDTKSKVASCGKKSVASCQTNLLNPSGCFASFILATLAAMVPACW